MYMSCSHISWYCNSEMNLATSGYMKYVQLAESYYDKHTGGQNTRR